MFTDCRAGFFYGPLDVYTRNFLSNALLRTSIMICASHLTSASILCFSFHIIPVACGSKPCGLNILELLDIIIIIFCFSSQGVVKINFSVKPSSNQALSGPIFLWTVIGS
ncbi:hypothetical protein ACJX0J_035452 [Zea mays]